MKSVLINFFFPCLITAFVAGFIIQPLFNRTLPSPDCFKISNATLNIEPITSFTPTRVKDLTTIVAALEKFKLEHGHYPHNDLTATQWVSKLDYHVNERSFWIPNLHPQFITEVPTDFRNNEKPDQQYAYKSNGAHFKLISLNPDDCNFVKHKKPSMIDPIRNCAAYGYWSPGGKFW